MNAAAPPKLVFWESTAGCNLECKHCRRLEVSKELSRGDLTTEQIKLNLIDRLAEIGSPILVFSGGEPLLRPDILELAAHARRRQITIALATNGTLIDDTMAGRIVEAGFERVAISLDGAESSTHDEFRGQPGAFEGAVAGIKHLRNHAMSIQVNTTVTQHNMSELAAIHEKAIELGASAWHVFMFVPVGCGLEIPFEQQLVEEQYETTLRWLAQRSIDKRLFVRATCAPQYYRILAQQRKLSEFRHGSKFTSMTKGCLAATGIFFVSHTGDVFPCGYLPVSSGNIAQKSLLDIWNASHVFESLRAPDKLSGKCGICEFKLLCGGCRARSYAVTADYLAEEPCCAYQPAPRQSGIESTPL